MDRFDGFERLVWRIIGLSTGMVIATLLIDHAHAADDKTCSLYALKVANVVSALTNDPDVAMAAQDRAYAYCTVVDYPPDVKLNDPQPAAVKTEKVSDTVDTSDWAARCNKAYVSFRESDGTVLRRGTKKRVLCPLPK